MSPRPAKATRENFEAGKVEAYRAGEHGHSVRLFAEAGKLKLRLRNPKTGRKQTITLFEADSPALRAMAAKVAEERAEKLRQGAAAAVERAQAKSPEEVTIYDVALLYLRRAPGFPEAILSGEPTTYGRGVSSQVTAWYDALPQSVKDNPTVPKPKTLWADVYHFLRLFKDPRFARERAVLSLEPADATTYVASAELEGRNPRTCVNETDRLSCAIRYVMTQHRKSVGLPYNPLEGRIVDRTPAEIDAYSDEEQAQLLTTIERAKYRKGGGKWQLRVILGVASSGRRIGAILGLRASDHDLEAGTVVWRAEEAKGEAYNQGDVVLPMTPLHRAAVEWALEHHPNPRGADAPLLWQKKNPEKAIPQSTADRYLKELETAAGVPHVDRRAFHGFCRMAITRAADLYGDEKAAEYTGRTPETIRRYSYKKRVIKSMEDVAGGLGDPRKGHS